MTVHAADGLWMPTAGERESLLAVARVLLDHASTRAGSGEVSVVLNARDAELVHRLLAGLVVGTLPDPPYREAWQALRRVRDALRDAQPRDQ